MSGRRLAAFCVLGLLAAPRGAAAQQPPLPAPGTPPPPPAAPAPATPPEVAPAPGYPAPAYSPPAPVPPPPTAAPPAEMPETPTAAAAWPPGDESQVPDEPGKKKKKKKKGGQGDDENGDGIVRPQYRGGDIQIGGWILARGDLVQSERVIFDGTVSSVRKFESFDISVPSVRFRLDYQSIWPWLSGQLELDLAGTPDLRDGYVQGKWENFAVRVGQFKMPVLAFQMESPWVLPVVRRGLIHDLTVDWLDVAGRRPGATVTWRSNLDGIKPRLTIGAFQGSFIDPANSGDVGTRDTDFLTRQRLGAQSYVARGQVDVGSIEIGASYQHRLAAVAPPSPTNLTPERHLWTAGADFTVNHVFATGGLRIWADTLAGASWYEHPAKPVDDKDATFVTGRALVAYRFGGTTPEAPYIEPYFLAGVIDPDLDVSSDLGWEATVGVNGGYFGRFKLTLQAEIDRVQRNFPFGNLGLFLNGGRPNQMGLLAQVGLAF